MDAISDLLSTFFVSNKSRRHNATTEAIQTEVVVQTEVGQTEPEAVQTEPEAVQTEPEAVQTESEAVQTEPEAVQTESERTQKKDTSESIGPHDSTAIESSSHHIFDLQKYSVKASDIAKRNIMIVNNDLQDTITMLADLLHDLGSMKKCPSVYENSLYIITKDNKRLYKKLLLDNPYLYFNDLVVKNVFTKATLYEIEKLDKKAIVILEYYDHESEDHKLKDLISTLLNFNVQVILVSQVYNAFVAEMYSEIFGKYKMLINKKDKLKSLQKKLFNNVLTKIADNVRDVPFIEYHQFINSEEYSAKYIYVKNNEVMYV